VLDYATREVVIQAEAGKRRGPWAAYFHWRRPDRSRRAQRPYGRIPRRRSGGWSDETTIPDSVAAIALPVFYAEQLHAILYIESSVPVDFSEEEVLLLRTLADLIAGALHNALSFQKAQEQAITDGLTGVKTHRFFMEALSANGSGPLEPGARLRWCSWTSTASNS